MKGKRVLKFIVGLLVVVGIGISSLYMIYARPYKDIVYVKSSKYGVDPLLIYSIMKAESKFDSQAISPSGAKGLMQIMNKTGTWGAEVCGISNFAPDQLFNPEINIEIGTWYIAKLLSQYEGNIDTALAAYNAGSGNVAKWKANTAYSLDGKTIHRIPFKETDNYIKRVNFNYWVYKLLYKI